MVRVLTVIDQYWPYEGGAENIARFIVERTNVHEGVDNNVLTVAKKTIDTMAGRPVPLCEEVDNLYTIYRFRLARIGKVEKNGRFFRFINLAKYIWKIIALRNHFDIIHAHTFYWSTAGSIIASKILRKPIIITGHSTLTMLQGEIEDGHHPAFLLRLLRYTDYYVAINTYIKDEANRIACVASGKVEVICNGIDIERYKPVEEGGEKRELREQLGLPVDRSIIIYHGRFEEYKNLQTLLVAISNLQSVMGGKVLLLLIGNGPYQSDLESLVDDLGIQKLVKFIKFNKEVHQYLQASDIYCLPSYVEGLSLSLLEAMACGLVCLASNIDGNKEAVDDGENGFLFDPHESQALTTCLSSLMDKKDKPRLDTIGNNARQKIVEKFSIDNMVEKYCSLYDKASVGR